MSIGNILPSKGSTLRFVLDFTRNLDAINAELLSVHPSVSSFRGNGTLPHPRANKTGKHEELYINCMRVFKNDEYMLIGKPTHLFTSSSHFLTSSNHSSDVTSWMWPDDPLRLFLFIDFIKLKRKVKDGLQKIVRDFWNTADYVKYNLKSILYLFSTS